MHKGSPCPFKDTGFTKEEARQIIRAYTGPEARHKANAAIAAVKSNTEAVREALIAKAREA